MSTSRRGFIALAASAPFIVAERAGAQGQAACYDPASLPFSQKSRRRALGYVEATSNPGKHCSICTFFSAAASAGCGQCQLLSGGPVNAGAVCNSFAPKAK